MQFLRMMILTAVVSLLRLGERGTASAKASADYTSFITNKLPRNNTDLGREVALHIKHTVVSGETVSGTVTLGIHPAGWAFTGLRMSTKTTALSASAGVGQAPVIGDGTTANKYMLASDFDAVAAIGLVNGESYGYKPTADKTITLTWGATGTPVVGAIVEGYMYFIPNG